MDESASRESWHDEYRYGAFFLFPPPEVAGVVDPLRERYDPKSAAICGAHVTLSEPLPGPLSNDQLAELRATLATLLPFEITYGPITSVDPHPGVVIAISPEDAFFALRSAVHSTSIFAGCTLTRADRKPHMTIAEFITLDATHELLESLRGTVSGGAFLCDRVVHAAPDASFRFEPTATIPLGP